MSSSIIPRMQISTHLCIEDPSVERDLVLACKEQVEVLERLSQPEAAGEASATFVYSTRGVTVASHVSILFSLRNFGSLGSALTSLMPA